MSHQLLINDLRLHVKGDVLSDEYSLGMYATDASVYQIRPVAVVAPLDEADVRTVLKIAADHSVTILPRGGGTSLAGQTVGHSVVLDFSKYMNSVLELNAAEKWIRVQPGIVRDELNAYLEPYGLLFAPDPATSSRANVGGMIGNNSSGTKSILYGKTVDHVLSLKVALADGTLLDLHSLDPAEYEEKVHKGGREGQIYQQFKAIIEANREEIKKRFPKVMRRVGGYNLDEFVNTEHWNLSKLFTGSEGTLGVTLEAKINLVPLPKYKSVCVVHFAEVLEAIRAVEPMLAFRPSAIEILDKNVVGLSRKNLLTQRSCHFIEGYPAAIQIVEFYGDSPEDVMDRPHRMVSQLKAMGMGYAYPIFPEGPDYEDVWTIRKKGLGLMLGLKGAKRPLAFIEDAAIPTQHLPEYIDKVLQICEKHETEVAMYAHASVGVIHVRPILDLREKSDIERFKNIASETFELVKHFGGSWSGEHGDGLVRSPFNEDFFGTRLYQAFQQIKRLFDPENRMNPGKIIDAPPMDQNLRYGSKYRDQALHTHFHFREDGSFEAAVHMCTGVGECRKMIGGTMCPSFKATRDEEHSTRGRANALRLAMSGQMDAEGLAGKRLKEVLDLCLSCKACKSECPSNVDMAKLKSEVLQKHYDKWGPGVRDYLIADAMTMARRMSGRLSSIINWTQSRSLFRAALQGVAGFDRQRILPAYAAQSFSQWYKNNYKSNLQTGKKVVLFADTYLNYHEPEIGIAACRLLQFLGYEVLLADVGCCQRPRISHGFLKKAKKEGGKTANALHQFIREGLPIVVCEPSCASALNDDLPDLLDDEELSGALAQNIFMIDVFLARELEAGPISLNRASYPVFIHGHCHQKALYGTRSMHRLLAGAPGLELREIESGCCGMAGSFGYEKEHYEISRKIGEQILFPVIRKAPDNAIFIACGVSCRHQIEHFTDRKAIHWVELMSRLISVE